jgi:RNA polymerase sigma-70 factor (ECF subfamily)
MDTSIRLYHTNSSLRSPLEEERSRRTTSQLPANEDTHDGEEDEGTLAPSPALAPAEQAERVDVADFEAIFLRYQTPITNFIYHLIGNREQAYDLAQDVFVKAYKALLGGTVVQPGALSAWLYRIAANTTTDTLRRRRLISWLPLSLFNEDRGIGAGMVSESGNASSDFGSGDEMHESRSSAVNALYERGGYDGGRFESRVAEREIVERVLSQMPQKYASCLWLYENDGLSCAEIAQVLNISPSAVKMRLMRARERFIGLYNKEVGED